MDLRTVQRVLQSKKLRPSGKVLLQDLAKAHSEGRQFVRFYRVIVSVSMLSSAATEDELLHGLNRVSEVFDKRRQAIELVQQALCLENLGAHVILVLKSLVDAVWSGRDEVRVFGQRIGVEDLCADSAQALVASVQELVKFREMPPDTQAVVQSAVI